MAKHKVGWVGAGGRTGFARAERVVWGIYVAGPPSVWPTDIAVDADSSVYVCGSCGASEFRFSGGSAVTR